MNDWTAEQLDRIGEANEIDIVPRRADGSLHGFTTVWVVRAGDDLYVRSFNGPDGTWFTAAASAGAGRIRAAGQELDVALEQVDVERATVDAAYRAKYRGSGYVDAMVDEPAAATTLQLRPA